MKCTHRRYSSKPLIEDTRHSTNTYTKCTHQMSSSNIHNTDTQQKHSLKILIKYTHQRYSSKIRYEKKILIKVTHQRYPAVQGPVPGTVFIFLQYIHNLLSVPLYICRTSHEARLLAATSYPCYVTVRGEQHQTR